MLSDPSGPVKIFQQWRELLRESDYTLSVPPEMEKLVVMVTTDDHTSSRMDAYDRLVWEIWMPKLRRVLSSWTPKGEVS